MPKEKATNCSVAGLKITTAHYLLGLCLPDCIPYSSAKDIRDTAVYYPLNTEDEKNAICELIKPELISIQDNTDPVSFTVTVTRKGWEKMFEIIDELKRAGKIRTGHTNDGIAPRDYPSGLRPMHQLPVYDAGTDLSVYG